MAHVKAGADQGLTRSIHDRQRLWRALKADFEKQGAWLFRWRGYLPFLILPAAFAAFLQSGYVLAMLDEQGEELWALACILVSLVGLGISALTVGHAPAGTSGRNTHEQRAQSLNTTGMYSVVRHPVYLGNYVIFLGFVLAIKVWWFVLLAALAYALYYERIMFAEESILRKKFGASHADWSERTPAFLPNPRPWRRPALQFSARNVLRREYNGFHLIVLYYTLLEFTSSVLFEGEVWLNGWARNGGGRYTSVWALRYSSWSAP